MNIRVVKDDHEEDMSIFVVECNTCGAPITDPNRGVARWFEDSGHIVVAHKGKCDVALKSQIGDLPAVSIAVLTLCVAAGLGVESRDEWMSIWDENIGELDESCEEECEEDS